MKRITYIFKSGRVERLNQPQPLAKEFYYSYDQLSKANSNLTYIEDEENLNRKYKYVDKLLKRYDLPFNLSRIINKDNINVIKKSEIIFSTNPGLAITISPFIKLIKRKQNLKFITINSGIFDEITNHGVENNKIKEYLIRKFLEIIDIIIFTSKTEHASVSAKYHAFSSKFVNHSFCIDTDFWVEKKEYSENRNGVLFMGNNSNRDFEKVVAIAEALPHIEFKFISTEIEQSSIPQNVTLFKGDWNENIMSDSDIKKLYSSSRLTFLPLKNTLVASGQSTAMQAMASGCPVVISNTIGFWDSDNFEHKKNIYLVDENTVENWKYTIDKLYNDYELLKKISINGQILMTEKFTLEIFENNLKNLFHNL